MILDRKKTVCIEINEVHASFCIYVRFGVINKRDEIRLILHPLSLHLWNGRTSNGWLFLHVTAGPGFKFMQPSRKRINFDSLSLTHYTCLNVLLTEHAGVFVFVVHFFNYLKSLKCNCSLFLLTNVKKKFSVAAYGILFLRRVK